MLKGAEAWRMRSTRPAHACLASALQGFEVCWRLTKADTYFIKPFRGQAISQNRRIQAALSRVLSELSAYSFRLKVFIEDHLPGIGLT